MPGHLKSRECLAAVARDTVTFWANNKTRKVEFTKDPFIGVSSKKLDSMVGKPVEVEFTSSGLVRDIKLVMAD